MRNKDRIIFALCVICLILAAGLLVSAAQPVEGKAKPDIVLTPSYTDYLTFDCFGGAGGVGIEHDEGSTSSGKLYCLPIRPE